MKELSVVACCCITEVLVSSDMFIPGRSTKNVTRFTILLNNMRLMGILSWWMEVLDFIYTTPDNPFLTGAHTFSLCREE